MIKSLTSITSLQTGVNAKPGVDANAYYIQARQFNSNAEFIKISEPDISFTDLKSRHILKENDVLVVTKGWKNNAIVWRNFVTPAVASSVYIIIRVLDENIILPAYLNWFINTPNVQQYLQKNAKGSVSPSLTKEVLGNLQIPVPSIKKQKIIVALADLANKQKKLQQQLDELKDTYLQNLVLNAIQ